MTQRSDFPGQSLEGSPSAPKTTGMTLARFRVRLETEGSDWRHWPDPDERAAAQALLSANPAAQTVWCQAQALDQALAASAPQISPARAGRVLARLEARLDAWQALPGGGRLALSHAGGASPAGRSGLTLPLWPVLGLLMGLGLAGFVSGHSVPFPDHRHAMEGVALAALLTPVSSSVSYLSELDR